MINVGIRGTLNPKYSLSSGFVGAAVDGGVSGGLAPQGFAAVMGANMAGTALGRFADDLAKGLSLKESFSNGIQALKAGLAAGLVANAAISRIGIGDLGELGSTVANAPTAAVGEAASEALPLGKELAPTQPEPEDEGEASESAPETENHGAVFGERVQCVRDLAGRKGANYCG
jgi:hypothetical protein